MNLLTINGLIQSTAQSYLDPGSGSILIQILLATLLGASAAIAVFWRKIKAFFTGKKGGEGVVEDPTVIAEDDPTAVPSDSTFTKE